MNKISLTAIIVLFLSIFMTVSASQTDGNLHQIDLRLVDLSVHESNERYSFTATIVNPSRFTIPAEEVKIIYLLSDESPVEKDLPDIPAMSEEIYSFELGSLKDRYYLLEVELVYEHDINPDNNFLSTTFIKGSSPLVLNELLFKETPDNQEWVEIYNRSDYSIEMDDFFFIDAAETITLFSGIIKPKTYVVICRDKDKLLSFYPNIKADNVIESSSWAILNNDKETILFSDKYNTEFDYTEYRAPASYPHDVSLERINPYCDDPAWERCIDPQKSTPTFPNSHMPPEYDLAIMKTLSSQDGNSITHQVTVENKGYRFIENFLLNCYAYYDEDMHGNLVFTREVNIDDGKTAVKFKTAFPAADYVVYKYELKSALDMDESNNSGLSFFNVDALPVVVNEIMFRTFENQPKWVELYVNHRYKHLHEVIFTSQRDSLVIDVTLSDYILITNNAEDSLYLAERYNIADSPIYTGLRNLYVAGEELTIFDPGGNIIERFAYDSAWNGERGISLERINPLLPALEANWGPSIAATGCTPAYRNSIYTVLIPAETVLEISPNPFSPVRGERTIISFEFPERLNRVTCRIFDLKGRLVNTIVNQELQAAQGSIIWDGSKDNHTRLPIGIYIITLEASGYDSEKIYTGRSTVVIGK